MRNQMKYVFCLILLSGIPFICKPQDTTPMTQKPPDQIQSRDTLHIGKYFAGGIIYYIDGTGRHGLIVSANDLPEKMPFGCPDREVFANSLSDGTVNTILINKYCGTETAADRCSRYDAEGYKDWYLPSIDELALLFKSQLPPGLFTGDIYWSSTECRDCRRKFVSWVLDFKNAGERVTMYKEKKAHVRAIRKF